MGNRKRFSKKQSVTFNLVSKSHQDPETLDCDNTRVWKPGPAELSEEGRKRKKEQVECGIYFEDDYDYMQHLRERNAPADLDVNIENHALRLWDISEEGQFNDCTSEGQYNDRVSEIGSYRLALGNMSGSSRSRNQSISSQHAVDTFGGDYNVMAASVAEGPQPHWDPDVVETLNEDFDDFCEDLEDDFITLALGNGDLEQEFPSLEDAKYINAQDPDEVPDCFVDDSFSKWHHNSSGPIVEDVCFDQFDDHVSVAEKSQKSRFTEYSMTSSVVPRSEYQTDIDDHFETMYGEYDDLEVGALDHEEVRGNFSVEDPAIEYILGLHDPVIEEAKASGLDSNHGFGIEDLRLDEMSDSDVNSDDLMPQSPKKPEFDCESILSTYSNLYHHPKIIKSEKTVKVKLDARTGLPITPKDEKAEQFADAPPPEIDFDRLKWIPPNVRRRDETKEETRERQKVQKEEQRLRRIEKKNNKIAFKMEEIKQQRADINRRKTQGRIL